MEDRYISLLLAAAIGAGSFEVYSQHEHVPEDYYPTTPIEQVEVPYITGSYVGLRTFPYNYGTP